MSLDKENDDFDPLSSRISQTVKLSSRYLNDFAGEP